MSLGRHLESGDMPSELKAVRRRLRQWTQMLLDLGDRQIWLPIGAALLSLIALIVVLKIAPSRPDPTSPGETSF